MVSGVANFSRSLAASASGFMVPTAPISTTILPAAAWSFLTSSAYSSSRSGQRGAGVDAAHDAEVEEHDLAVGVDEQIARVQVAMEQAVAQPALEDAEQQRLNELGAVEAGLADRRGVVDADAVRPVPS